MDEAKLVKPAPAKAFRHLPWLLGIALFVAMTALLWNVAEDIIDHEVLASADPRLSYWLHAHGSSSLTTTMLIVTFFGSTIGVSLIAIPFGVYLIAKRRFFWLLTLVASVLGGAGLNRLLKYIFHRPRPQFDDPILKLTSYSFPSGHTMMATVLYGVIAAYFFTNIREPWLRFLVIASAGLLILLVGFSRIYLGAHYLSDVIAALAEGLAWLSLSLTIRYSISTPDKRS
ncbi:MAG TPA: phosphatase PAP2 family protein [Pyrinomonadaceae bacterium]|nr:phosphatase PAP2 family protein [Pyrinomonadaceae bacterium]